MEERIQSYNFTLPIVDALVKENVRLPADFLQGFRLGLYAFTNYKSTQELNAVYQVVLQSVLSV